MPRRYQPDDETPIRPGTARSQSYTFDQVYPQLVAELDAATAPITAALKDRAVEASATLQAALNDVNRGIREVVAASHDTLNAAINRIGQGVARMDRSIMATLNKAEDRLVAAGVEYPQGHGARLATLAAGPEELVRRLAPAFERVGNPIARPPGPGDCPYNRPLGLYEGGNVGDVCTYGLPGHSGIGVVVDDPTSPTGKSCAPAEWNPVENRAVAICNNGVDPNATGGHLNPDCETNPHPEGSTPGPCIIGPDGSILGGYNSAGCFVADCYPPSVGPPPVGPPPPPISPPPVGPPPPPVGPPPPPVGPPPVSPPGVCCPAPVSITVMPAPVTVINQSCPPGTAPPPAPPTAPPVSPGPSPPPSPPGPPPPPGSPPTAPPPAPPGPPPPPPINHLPANQNSVDWEHASACTHVKELCEKFAAPPKSPPTSPPPATTATGSWWNGVVQGAETLWDVFQSPGAAAFNSLVSSGGEGSTGTSAVSGLWRAGSAMSAEWLSKFLPAGVHNPNAAALFSVKLGLAGFVTKWLGVPLDWYSMSDRYAMQYCDPQLLPSQADADMMWLRDQLSDDDWLCMTKANGNLPGWAKGVRTAKETLPNLNELVQLYLRKKIKDKPALIERVKTVGVRSPERVDEWLELAKQLPGYADLIRMMVRDSFDDDVSKKYKYDEGFDKKFTGKAKEWSESQGIEEDIFKFLWRAHWQIPSNTQLYEMLHRLRGDRPEVVAWMRLYDPEGTGEVPEGTPPKPPVVTIEDVREALQINDSAPDWVDKLIKISYRPITNTDARRMYQNGQLTDDDLVDKFQDTGYSRKDAVDLQEYEAVLKDRSLATMSGVLSVRELSRYYQLGLLTRDEADKQLAFQVPDKKLRARLLDQIEERRRLEVLRVRVAYLRKRFLFGLDDEEVSRGLLGIAGMPRIAISDTLDLWRYDKLNRLKQPRVAQLCKWFTNGYLSDKQYLKALENLGYSEEDSFNIARICWSEENVRRHQKAAKAAQDRMREIERRARQQRQDLTAEQKRLQKEIDEYMEKLRDLQLTNPLAPMIPS